MRNITLLICATMATTAHAFEVSQKEKITLEVHSKCVETLNRGPMSDWESDLNKQICECSSKRFVDRYYPFNDDQRPLEAYKKIVKKCNTEKLFKAANDSKE